MAGWGISTSAALLASVGAVLSKARGPAALTWGVRGGGWRENRDFGGALAKRGGSRIKSASACGVHMGVKSGRVAGDRLGYSQVVNPIYLLRKGTMSRGQVVSHLFGNISSNVARALSPEPFIDRRGRLRGNLRGLADVLRGRLEPDRAAAIQPGRKR